MTGTLPPAAAEIANGANGWVTESFPALISLADISVFSSGAGQIHDAFFVKLAQHINHFPLRIRDVFDFYLAQGVHPFFHQLDSFRGHVSKETPLQFGHRPFDRQRARLFVYSSHQLPNSLAPPPHTATLT